MTAVGMVCAADTLAPHDACCRRSRCAWIGAALLAVFAAMIALLRRGAAHAAHALDSGCRFTIPARRDFVAQIALAVVDVIAAGLALWALLPHAHVGFGEFITVFSAAMLLGMIGHTPGGVGVFEAAMVFALGGSVQTPRDGRRAARVSRDLFRLAADRLGRACWPAFEGRALKGRFAFLQPAPRVAARAAVPEHRHVRGRRDAGDLRRDARVRQAHRHAADDAAAVGARKLAIARQRARRAAAVRRARSAAPARRRLVARAACWRWRTSRCRWRRVSRSSKRACSAS